MTVIIKKSEIEYELVETIDTLWLTSPNNSHALSNVNSDLYKQKKLKLFICLFDSLIKNLSPVLKGVTDQ